MDLLNTLLSQQGAANTALTSTAQGVAQNSNVVSKVGVVSEVTNPIFASLLRQASLLPQTTVADGTTAAIVQAGTALSTETDTPALLNGLTGNNETVSPELAAATSLLQGDVTAAINLNQTLTNTATPGTDTLSKELVTAAAVRYGATVYTDTPAAATYTSTEARNTGQASSALSQNTPVQSTFSSVSTPSYATASGVNNVDDTSAEIIAQQVSQQPRTVAGRQTNTAQSQATATAENPLVAIARQANITPDRQSTQTIAVQQQGAVIAAPSVRGQGQVQGEGQAQSPITIGQTINNAVLSGTTPLTTNPVVEASVIDNGGMRHYTQAVQAASDNSVDVLQSSYGLEQKLAELDAIDRELYKEAPSRPHTSTAEQVSVKVANAIKTGDKLIHIQLEPAALGQVDVQIDVQQNGKTSITVLAEKADTLELLQRDAKSLERALQNAGIEADSGSMEFNLKGQQHFARQDQQGQHASGQYGKRFAMNGLNMEVANETQATHRLNVSDRALDIVV